MERVAQHIQPDDLLTDPTSKKKFLPISCQLWTDKEVNTNEKLKHLAAAQQKRVPIQIEADEQKIQGAGNRQRIDFEKDATEHITDIDMLLLSKIYYVSNVYIINANSQ